MNEYYVSRNAHENGEHEVHSENCPCLPEEKNLISLGKCDNCYEAMGRAKQYFPELNGCYYCCYECNKALR